MAKVEFVASKADGEICMRGDFEGTDPAVETAHAALLLSQGFYQVLAPKSTDATANVIDTANLTIIPRPASQPLPIGRAWKAFQATARAALDKSDITVLRCFESAVALPAAWVAYRVALRAIVAAPTGDPTQPLPAAPAYPAAT